MAEDFPGLPVINRGFGGSGVADAVRYLDRVVVPLSPRAVVLYAGGNNIGTLTPPAIAAEMSTLVVALRAALPTTRIILLSLKPTRARAGQAEIVREVNRRYAELAAAHAEVVYVDLWTPFLDATGQPDARWLADDGHHPSREGYQRIAERTRRHLP